MLTQICLSLVSLLAVHDLLVSSTCNETKANKHIDDAWRDYYRRPHSQESNLNFCFFFSHYQKLKIKLVDLLFDCDTSTYQDVMKRWDRKEFNFSNQCESACSNFRSLIDKSLACLTSIDFRLLDLNKIHLFCDGYEKTMSCVLNNYANCSLSPENIFTADKAKLEIAKVVCTTGCSDVKGLMKELLNCWGHALITQNMTKNQRTCGLFSAFSECAISLKRCSQTLVHVDKLFTLFSDDVPDERCFPKLTTTTVSVSSEINNCEYSWKMINQNVAVDTTKCQLLSAINTCIKSNILDVGDSDTLNLVYRTCQNLRQHSMPTTVSPENNNQENSGSAFYINTGVAILVTFIYLLCM